MRKMIVIRRPQGIAQSQGQSDNYVFNSPHSLPPGYQNYDEEIGRLIPLAAGIALRVLPANKLRTMLTVINRDVANEVLFRFGSQASATEGVPLPPGGVAFYDIRVPNQDVWVFATAGITPGIWVAEATYQTRR